MYRFSAVLKVQMENVPRDQFAVERSRSKTCPLLRRWKWRWSANVPQSMNITANNHLQSEEFCNSALAICEILRPFLKQNAAHSKLVDVVQIDRTIAEIHHNHGCINAEMNRPQDALRHQLIFNNMMQKELAGKQGSDMRLAMSYNELGVAHMINESKCNNDHNNNSELKPLGWVEGEDCFKMSIQEMKLLDNYKKYKISLPLVNLASCHYLNGDYVKAEELLLEGLADRVEEFGIDDRESFM